MKKFTDALDNLLDRPIAFNPSFKKVTGSTNAALLLSQAFYWTKRTQDPNGWFYKTRDEWMEETGLTEAELDGARDKCRKSDVMEEKLKGVPATMHYRVNKKKVYELLGFQFPENTETEIPEKPESSFPENFQIPEKPESGSYGDFNKESETTTRNTTDIVSTKPKKPKANAHPELLLFRDVTKRYPHEANWQDVISDLQKVKTRLGRDVTADDLLPFFKFWTGKGYNSYGLGWLEWAVVGKTPQNGTWRPQNANYQNDAQGKSDYTENDRRIAEKIKQQRLQAGMS